MAQPYYIMKRGNVFHCKYADTGQRVSLKTTEIAEAYRRAEKGFGRLDGRGKTFGKYLSEKKFFKPGCSHLYRIKIREDRVLSGDTITKHLANLEHHIIKKYYYTPLSEITAKSVDEWLLSLQMSNSTRNNILCTLRIVMREAERDELIPLMPKYENFRRNSRRRDTLTEEEIKILFPLNADNLRALWRFPRADTENEDLMFGVMFAFALCAGLRSGEVRALHRAQLFPEKGGIIIDRAYDHSEELTFPKKGDKRDPRFRLVLVPEIGWRYMDMWLKTGNPGVRLFSFMEHPITGKHFNHRFVRAVGKHINTKDRWITAHSLRYTWVTRMQTHVTAELLRDMAGHRSEAMTDHYSRPYMLDRLNEYQDRRQAVEGFSWVG
jgi:integrase